MVLLGPSETHSSGLTLPALSTYGATDLKRISLCSKEFCSLVRILNLQDNQAVMSFITQVIFPP